MRTSSGTRDALINLSNTDLSNDDLSGANITVTVSRDESAVLPTVTRRSAVPVTCCHLLPAAWGQVAAAAGRAAWWYHRAAAWCRLRQADQRSLNARRAWVRSPAAWSAARRASRAVSATDQQFALTPGDSADRYPNATSTLRRCASTRPRTTLTCASTHVAHDQTSSLAYAAVSLLPVSTKQAARHGRLKLQASNSRQSGPVTHRNLARHGANHIAQST